MKIKLFLSEALQNSGTAFGSKQLQRSSSPHSRIPGRVRALCILALLLSAPAAVQAQFDYAITNGTVTITGYTGPGGNVTIPDTIEGLPVTTVGDRAFLERSVTGIVIPDTVTSIGGGAFYNCYSLTNAPIGNKGINIGRVAFYNCQSLPTIAIPNSVTTIEPYGFGRCDSLTNATVGNGVTNIGMGGWARSSLATV